MAHNGAGKPTLNKEYATARKTKRELKTVDLISYFKNPSKVALKHYLTILGWVIGILVALKVAIMLLNHDWKTKTK